MIDNFSNSITPSTGKEWKTKSESQRIKIISNFLKSNVVYKEFLVMKAPDNGQIVIRIDHLIPSNKRGVLLLDLENELKKNIDEGITIWCEPVGDKSKLRKLRGVVIKS
ncbi:hypothetical protein [Candidatus Pelagibacter sp. HIMB1593]|uniref:hypothetical protein n=1 Tax=Candidatus Pelagibacter sp. HIMB1593 TaxID=3413355 RepID=UPI003F879307